MTTATLAIGKAQKNLQGLQTKISSVDMPSVNWKLICCVGVLMSSILLVFYVWQINDLTRSSYTINEYQNKISKLTAENKNLQVSFAENSFLGQAIVKIQALNFQKAAPAKYVQIPESSSSSMAIARIK